MAITRRTFVAASLGTAALGSLIAGRTIAQTAIGEGVLTTVSDGHLVLPESFVIGDLDAGEATRLIEPAGFQVGAMEAPCNLTLWRSGDVVALVDAGSGPGFMPTAGRIVESLEAVGLGPEEITHVLFTHGHPDHLWGAIDDFDEPLFGNARHYLGAEEMAYWMDPATMETIGADRQSFVAGAQRRIALLGDALVQIGAGDEVLPGVVALDMRGHTPGHLGFRVTHGADSALIVGDAIGNGHLALLRPDWPSPADSQPDQGIETRMALLEELAASGERMVGFHLPRGGLGRIVRDGEAYAFLPD